jgi:hypothetical protein
MQIIEEKMSDFFTKYHLQGLPFDAVLHHFADIDRGAPHDHPFSFITHILKGGYIERVYDIKEDGTWESELVHRYPNTAHLVSANHIHRIEELPMGDCWTIIMPFPKVKDSGFYRFDERSVSFRYWYEQEFKKLK